jgi:Heterokaryon incompatibility protein (HET)
MSSYACASLYTLSREGVHAQSYCIGAQRDDRRMKLRHVVLASYGFCFCRLHLVTLPNSEFRQFFSYLVELLGNIYGITHRLNLFIMSASQFHYSPLSAASQIRLVTISPGVWEDNIVCSLETTFLDGHGPYEALSYVWGDAEVRKPIVLNGQQFGVTANLELALRYLRRDKPRVMWIDAICINQNDTEEKNSQVRLMRKIYEAAVETVVWLRESSERSKLCFRNLERLNIGDRFEGRDAPDPDLDDLRVLSCPAWWSRVWVIQELVVSENVVLKAGHDELRWPKLEWPTMMMKWGLALDINYSLWRVWDLHRMYDTKTSFEARTPLNISKLVASHRNASATDPRDMVFSLVGLSEDPEAAQLVPDYSLTTEKVFRNLFEYSVTKDKSLNIIGFSFGFIPNRDWPSWVPDWGRYTLESSPCPLINDTLDGNRLFGKTADQLSPESVYGFTASSDTSPQTNILAANSTLMVNGVYLDNIGAVGESLTGYPTDITAIFESWEGILVEKFATQLRGSSHSPTLFSIAEFFSDMCKSRLSYPETLKKSKVLKRIRRRFRPLKTDGVYVGGGTIREAYVRTLLTDRNPNGTRLTYAEYEKRWAHRKPVEKFIDVDLQVAATLRLIYLRRLMVSEKGYIGLVPRSAQQGDMICVLFGCSFPVIIRRWNDHHVFIGDSYIHGIMDGQAIKMLNDGILRKEQFVLR